MVFNGETKVDYQHSPRYSKTEIAVVNFIAWAMGRAPDSEFIHASLFDTLAVDIPIEPVQNGRISLIFPNVELASESSHWKTTFAGGVDTRPVPAVRLRVLVRQAA